MCAHPRAQGGTEKLSDEDLEEKLDKLVKVGAGRGGVCCVCVCSKGLGPAGPHDSHHLWKREARAMRGMAGRAGSTCCSIAAPADRSHVAHVVLQLVRAALPCWLARSDWRAIAGGALAALQ